MTSFKIVKLKLGEIVGPGEYGHVNRPQLTRRQPKGPHTHDFAEFFWTNEGAGWHVLNGVRHRLAVGDFWCIRPEDVHSIENGGESSLIITNIAFPAEALDWLRQRYFSGVARWFWAPLADRVAVRVDVAGLHVLDAMADRLAEAARDRLHFEHFLLGVFAILETPIKEQGLAGAPDWLANACRRMREPALLSEGVTAFFRVAGRSPEHVARVTRAALNLTPSEYVNRLRMDRAAFQLRMTSRPVTEIAMDVGYENLSHFFHVFRRLHGMSPRSYRERLTAAYQSF